MFYFRKLSGDQKENFHTPNITELFSLYLLHSTAWRYQKYVKDTKFNKVFDSKKKFKDIINSLYSVNKCSAKKFKLQIALKIF